MGDVNVNSDTKLTKQEIQHVSVLQRRFEFLQTRIDQAHRPEGWDLREYQALDWAIHKVRS